MDKKLNIAIIGCGTIGNVHADAFRQDPRVTISHAVDLVPERAHGFVEKYGAGSAHTDWRQVIADPMVGAISVCLPNHLHAENLDMLWH